METDSHNKYLFKRGKTDGLGFALLLVYFGTAFLLLNLDFLPEMYRPIFISWQTLLILIGSWSVLMRRKYTSGIILIAIGLFFLYPVLCSVFPDCLADINIDLRKYWPLFLIIPGVMLVAGKLAPSKSRRRRHLKKEYDTNITSAKSKNAENSDADFFKKNMIFGSTEQIILSHNFKGGDANVVFGELILDLRKAEPADDITYLELNTVFGNLIVHLPADWVVEVDSTTILGGFQDKRLQKEATSHDDKSVRFRIKASSVFGNIEIRD